ncbi:MAG: hypothetical protein M1818_004218 [Claussenomyces sp. TS43310]|nr:MAG: hypothetical protein M1818_004218 [Claussenomyces sp. TS43310]
MAEVEEPQFTSLQARIAALNQSQGSKPFNGPLGGKRAVPALPNQGADKVRPQLDSRSRTINNPPTTSFTSATTQYNNEPSGSKTLDILPPPFVDRDSPQPSPRVQGRKTMAPATVPPPLPRRETAQTPSSLAPKPSPALPPRKMSEHLMTRRGSNESTISDSSSMSALSIGGSSRGGSSTTSYESNSIGRKLPPRLTEANLPTLPPTKREREAKEKQERERAKQEREAAKQAREARLPVVGSRSSPAVPQISFQPPQYDASVRTSHITPNLPPRLPTRKTTPLLTAVEEPIPAPTRKLPHRDLPPVLQKPRIMGFEEGTEASQDVPPPIPRASRPTTFQLDSRKPSAQATHTSATPASGGLDIYGNPSEVSACLICRDFSGPDGVAKLYPRHANPDNSTDYLAEVLCGPFPSPTDKARAIFTWLHHNIDYDVDAFFNRTVKNHTAENTIARGLAVCGGYATVFSSIALKAGLDCVQVTGHGKGYSYTQPKPGDPIPPANPTGHAWNAVRIDNGEWKLIDCCWGAGHLSNKLYNRKFNASCFTMSNDEFGLRHFPADDQLFFRSDGQTLTWEQYIIGPHACETLQTYGVVQEYGIKETSFMPVQKQISIRAGGITHFQFSKMCEHWNFIKNGAGKPYCMILQYNGIDGREKDFAALEFDGTYWYLDMDTRKLGCAGQRINVYSVTSVGGKDARGWTKRDYNAAKGKQGMGFQTVASWDLV